MAVKWNKTDLPTLAQRKVDMANDTCQNTIYAGLDVELTTGTKHFSLSLEDQQNINSKFQEVTLGATECQYKEDGGDMVIYPAEDIVTIYAAARMLIDRQLAYCSYLKKWINRETDKNVLAGIEYGDDLPEDLDSDMDTVLASSTAQLEKVVAAVNDGAFVDKIKSLENQMTDAQLALCDVYELVLPTE